MRSRYKALLIVASFVVAIFLVSSGAFAQVSVPEKPAHHVVDLAGIINDDMEASLNKYLLELEQKTTAQFVVLTLISLEGEALEDLSIRIAHEKWKLGQKGKDNGVLLLVALQDRKYRFEIGYGLEGILPDSLVGSIGRQYLVPYFKAGDYSSGIFETSLAVITVISADAGVEITGMPQFRTPSGRVPIEKPSVAGTIFAILLIMGFIYMFIRHPRLLMFLIMMNMFGGGRRGGWSGGSGGFGGGGGGFGGGGGGGFGGGGASGNW
ncbi:MAG: TPM domain-containing protein [Nitrospiraceae bacterium]|nr:MAG: TPM domain-containing protein [Nitrospiraceae bacterium]